MIFTLNLSRLSDEQLMARAADSERAFAELYNRYARRLQGFFRRQLGGDGEGAADLMHDTFLRVYAARHAYRPTRPVAPWLFSIAFNLLKNRYRHLQAEAEAMARLDAADAAALPDVELQLDRDTLDRALRQALTELPAEARMLFALRFEEELSVAQTAAVMQLPEGTVKSRQHKIMNMIKLKLKQYENR